MSVFNLHTTDGEPKGQRLTISVAMATYNGEKFLREQLASLAAQVRLPDELIVVDDRSQDSTCAIVKQFAATSQFPVRLVVNELNVGSTENFSRACQACSGAVIALCDQDDVWLPDKLRQVEAALLAQPNAVLVFSDAVMVDQSLKPLGYTLWEAIGFSSAERQCVQRDQALDVLRRKFIVTGMSMAFRSQHLPLALPIAKSWFHDGWIAYCLAIIGPLAIIEEPLALYRQHAGQQLGERKRSRLEQYVRARRLGTPHLQRHREMYGALRQHLQTHAGLIAADNSALVASDLAEKIHHLDRRLWVRAAWWRRPLAITEWLNGRYQRFSFGRKSLLQDLIT